MFRSTWYCTSIIGNVSPGIVYSALIDPQPDTSKLRDKGYLHYFYPANNSRTSPTRPCGICLILRNPFYHKRFCCVNIRILCLLMDGAWVLRDNCVAIIRQSVSAYPAWVNGNPCGVCETPTFILVNTKAEKMNRLIFCNSLYIMLLWCMGILAQELLNICRVCGYVYR
jgi:hypothetical protein